VGLPSTISRLRRSSTVGLRASPLISGSSIGMSCPAVGPWSMPCATTCNLTASPCPSRGCLWMLLRRRPKVPPHSDPFPTLGRRQSRSGYLVNRTTTDGFLRLLPPPPPPAVIHCAIGGSVFLSATGSVSVGVEEVTLGFVLAPPSGRKPCKIAAISLGLCGHPKHPPNRLQH